MTRFSIVRLAAAGALFAILVAIAVFVREPFVRGTLGDVLVVVFLYWLLRAVTTLQAWPAAALVLAFACLVELGQAFNLVERLGLQDNVIARVVIGAHANWSDVAAYAVGALLSLALDRRLPPRSRHGP